MQFLLSRALSAGLSVYTRVTKPVRHVCPSYAAMVLFGRERPSFRILLFSVVRLSPSLSAAPLGPPITQFFL